MKIEPQAYTTVAISAEALEQRFVVAGWKHGRQRLQRLRFVPFRLLARLRLRRRQIAPQE